MKKLVNDLSALTTISINALVELQEKIQLIIAHDVYENYISGNPLCEIDVGIGTLYIKYEEEKIKYKFIPSKKLEENVLTTIKSKRSPLITTLETTLKDRIENTYKDLL